MSQIILLDTGVLSILTAKKGHEEGDACRAWQKSHLATGTDFAVPEITDYELRRELLRAGKSASIARLDLFISSAMYLPLTTIAMRRAAQLWAQSRNTGHPTSAYDALDGDVILCAQALSINWGLKNAVIATTNPKHLLPFFPARLWKDIIPIMHPRKN